MFNKFNVLDGMRAVAKETINLYCIMNLILKIRDHFMSKNIQENVDRNQTVNNKNKYELISAEPIL